MENCLIFNTGWNLLININIRIIGIIDRIIMQYAWITNCNRLLYDIRVTFDILF